MKAGVFVDQMGHAMKIETLLTIPFLISYYFWFKGIFFRKEDDRVLALAIIIFAAFFSISLSYDSGVFNFIGSYFIVFGLIGMIFNYRMERPKKKRVKEYSGVFLVIGVLFSLVA